MEEVKTVIEIGTNLSANIDTALKIGLGALIAAVSSLITLKINQKNKVSKEKRAFKLKILDEASITLEEYFRDSFNLLKYYYNISTKENVITINDLKKRSKKRLQKLINNYTRSGKIKESSISRFNIIDLIEIENLIIKHNNKIINFNNLIIIEKKEIPNSEEIRKTIRESIKIKRDCHTKINQYFENLK